MHRGVVALVGTTALVASLGWATPAWAQDASGTEAVAIVLPAEDADDQAKAEERDAKAAVEARIAMELAFARGEGKAKDVHGFMESLYQGKWYMPKKEAVRKCIVDRESNFHYKAVSRGGIYRGAYQMNRALAIGVSWMMQKEVRKEMGDEGLKLVRALRSTKTQVWNRYWQDRAFWTIWRKGEGSRHWGYGAKMCIKRAKKAEKAEARRQAQEQREREQQAQAQDNARNDEKN